MDLDCYAAAVRVIKHTNDHYSDQSNSFRAPKIPEKYQMNDGNYSISHVPVTALLYSPIFPRLADILSKGIRAVLRNLEGPEGTTRVADQTEGGFDGKTE